MTKQMPLLYSRSDEGGCWPTPEQELLLQAALLQGDKAINAWQQWKSKIDLDLIDGGSHRLLPLLYHNLNNLGIEDPILNKYKGVYRLTWYDNQIKFNQLRLLLDRLQQVGIRTMLLKGAALTLLHYQDYGLRPMADLDVLVPRVQASVAIELLVEMGWTVKNRTLTGSLKADLHWGGAYHFIKGNNEELDLHWHVLSGYPSTNVYDEFWEGALATSVNGISTNAMNPTDQLLHVCAHGAQWQLPAPLRWVADAVTVLNMNQADIDWNRLVRQAEKHQLGLPMRATLGYLCERWGTNIPPDVIERLRSLKTPKHEQVLYRLIIHPRGLLGQLPLHPYRYLRYTKGQKWFPRLKGFPKYLMYLWEKEHLWQLPIYIGVKGMKRLWKAINGHAG